MDDFNDYIFMNIIMKLGRIASSWKELKYVRHAIMVWGSGNNSSVLQKTINFLDDSEIDFFIHWDLKYKLPELTAHKSNIFFIPRMKVYWGTSTQVFAEQRL